MNIFQKQLMLGNKTLSESAWNEGWIGFGVPLQEVPTSVEEFEHVQKLIREYFASRYDDDETPETEPTDEPPIVLDGDDEAGEDTDE